MTCLVPALIHFTALPSLSCGWLRTAYELLCYYPAKENERGGLEVAIYERKSLIPSGPKAICGTVNVNCYRSVNDHDSAEASTPGSVRVSRMSLTSDLCIVPVYRMDYELGSVKRNVRR